MKILRLLALGIILGAGVLGGLSGPPVWGGAEPMTYSDADVKLLFQVARGAIGARLAGQPPPALEGMPANLLEPRGVFVTLHRQGSLRGCIGLLEAVKPLAQAVQEMAEAAAFQDPRFSPLRAEEMADLELEISVLTPMRRIDNIEDIQVGRHGLYLECGMYRGLLLPQVATEYNWDRLTFLMQTCRKAGLPPDAWQDPSTRIYIFSAEILKDQAPKAGS